MRTATSDLCLLVVDDEASQRQLMRTFFEGLGFQIKEAESAEQMLDILTTWSPAMILLDVRLPKLSGIEALPQVRKFLPIVPVILITAYADMRQAVAAVKQGADDYLSKPIDLEELRVAVYDALSLAPSDLRPSPILLPQLPEDFVLHSAAMRRLVETVAVVAPSDAPVLIQGPSGAGKEGIAQLIHGWSLRASQPIVSANCAGLSPTLVESELFGHIQGAFTGAYEDRQGLFRAACGGSLFLDEIGELPLEIQPKLLRVLETSQVQPVGSDRSTQVDTRLIAATNRNLLEEVHRRTFR
jgi:DNA-binding NtrC family response regulator